LDWTWVWKKPTSAFVDSEGKTVREVKVSTEPAAIRPALEGFADRLSRVGVEASSLGLWLYRELHASGLPIIVVEALDRRHLLELAEAHMAGIGPAPCRAVAAEDIRDLQRQARHARCTLAGQSNLLELQRDMLQRAHDLLDRLGGNPRIERRADVGRGNRSASAPSSDVRTDRERDEGIGG
jgi:transposase